MKPAVDLSAKAQHLRRLEQTATQKVLVESESGECEVGVRKILFFRVRERREASMEERASLGRERVSRASRLVHVKKMRMSRGELADFVEIGSGSRLMCSTGNFVEQQENGMIFGV
ncbi:hypothetical protein COLO4_21690 [Corchorus olitorius]|uniref:Uncharacterized protein n=1 Tax=Corchorus olitorius TaxID=93759 RepID=A0A1R3IRS1_9ROSI|nr:hypothetical protein COLO4_21690 [Corchorus olitorius]